MAFCRSIPLSTQLLRTKTTYASRITASAFAPAFTPLTTFKLGSSYSTSAPVNMAEVKSLVDSAIKDNNVVVFSKSYCPYCRKAKGILADVPDLKVFELDEIDDGSSIQNYLRELTGQSTVPNIFIGRKHIGGCSDLQALSANDLKERIAAAASA